MWEKEPTNAVLFVLWQTIVVVVVVLHVAKKHPTTKLYTLSDHNICTVFEPVAFFHGNSHPRHSTHAIFAYTRVVVTPHISGMFDSY